MRLKAYASCDLEVLFLQYFLCRFQSLFCTKIQCYSSAAVL